jgi:hypothetical protein
MWRVGRTEGHDGIKGLWYSSEPAELDYFLTLSMRENCSKMDDELAKHWAADNRQRQVLDHLQFGQWKLRDRLPVPLDDRMLERLLQLGWVELRAGDAGSEIRMTESGLTALIQPY